MNRGHKGSLFFTKSLSTRVSTRPGDGNDPKGGSRDNPTVERGDPTVGK